MRNDGGTRTDDTSLYGVIRATFNTESECHTPDTQRANP